MGFGGTLFQNEQKGCAADDNEQITGLILPNRSTAVYSHTDQSSDLEAMKDTIVTA